LVNQVKEIISAFLELLKTGKLPGFIVAFVCWSLLLLPPKVKHFIAIDKIIQNHSTIIGLLATISTAYFFAILIYEVSSKKIRTFTIRRTIIKKLKNLTEDEKKICTFNLEVQHKWLQLLKEF